MNCHKLLLEASTYRVIQAPPIRQQLALSQFLQDHQCLLLLRPQQELPHSPGLGPQSPLLHQPASFTLLLLAIQPTLFIRRQGFREFWVWE